MESGVENHLLGKTAYIASSTFNLGTVDIVPEVTEPSNCL